MGKPEALKRFVLSCSDRVDGTAYTNIQDGKDVEDRDGVRA